MTPADMLAMFTFSIVGAFVGADRTAFPCLTAMVISFMITRLQDRAYCRGIDEVAAARRRYPGDSFHAQVWAAMSTRDRRIVQVGQVAVPLVWFACAVWAGVR